MAENQVMKLYRTLLNHFGHQHWWPGDSKVEIIIGAIITQRTTWKNVEKAIDKLKETGLLDMKSIIEHGEEIPFLIRSSGFYRQKSQRIINFFTHVETVHHDLNSFLSQEPNVLRNELLSMNGIGPETADCILLYTTDNPIFVIDAYTRRILQRTGILHEQDKRNMKTNLESVRSDPEKMRYEELQKMFHLLVPMEIDLYRDFHAQFVMLGKQICKKRPLCETCPVNKICGYYSNKLHSI